MLSGEIKTPTKQRTAANCLYLVLLLFLLASVATLKAQTVYEYHQKEIYNYLSRMAQKGLVQFEDNIRPLTRKYIGACLDSLNNYPEKLSATEKKELAFYSQEYGSDMDSTAAVKQQLQFFKNDPYKRWRSLYATGKDVLLVADPVITAATYQQGGGGYYNKTSTGLNFWGRIGKHWGFQFFYSDITETGTNIDFSKQGTPGTGYVKRDTMNHSSLNYTQFRGSIGYSWKGGSLSFGQDYLLWGYGENGKIILSDKAPTYPYIRFDLKIFPWLKFNYVHAWLNSGIVDSSRTISNPPGGVYDDKQVFFVPKFFATHSFLIQPLKGLDLTLGESIIYNDRAYVGYLFPLMFFKTYDNIVNNGSINAGSNGQLFVQISSRNHLPKTHLYSTVFIDEIRMGSMFNTQKSRNQLGYTVGGSTTDLLVSYLTLGLEYTRVRPFVYRNLLPTQDYTSSGYGLGDWMGNNFDRISFTMKYTPIPKLKCMARYQSIRKGGMGTLAEQYFQQPQPPFLFDLQKKQQEFLLQCSYEWLNNLSLNTLYQTITEDNRVNGKKTTQNTFSIGVAYGL
jgi:hypothetical protein